MPRKAEPKRVKQGGKARVAGKSKSDAKPEDANSLDALVETLNAPCDWPSPTVLDDLKRIGEQQQPGFKEQVENEKSRRDAVPVAVEIRLNNANAWNPSDPEELEISLEKRGYYTPGQLRMEIEYFHSHPKAVPGGDRRALCEDQHNRALRTRELNPSLPPVPGYTDNPVVDEKNLWQWCIDAQAHDQAKAHEDAKPDAVAAPAGKPGMGGDGANQPSDPEEQEDRLPPSRMRAKAAYDYALTVITGAGKMTVAELFDSLRDRLDAEICKTSGQRAEQLREVRDYLPGNAETFGRYLREAGVKNYDKADVAGEEYPEPEKRCLKWRDLCSASVAAGVLFCLFEAIVYGIPWNWLRDHPATCGIQVTAGFFILVAMLGWFVPPWRKYTWWSALLGLGLVILSRL